MAAGILCAAVFVVGAPAARARVNVWTTHGRWYGGNGRALAIDPTTPSTLYAAAGADIFKSTDSGGSWSAANTGLSDLAVLALAIDPTMPSTLYAGTNGSGVYRSTNSGGGWTALNNGLTNTNVQALAIDPHTPNRLYAGTDAGVCDIALACVVGTGTGDSCTEAALDACLPGGAGFTGAATFNCGSEALTITITSTKNISADTTIDGRGLVTISGGNSVRLFLVNGGVNFTIQNLAIANGNGVGTGDPIINTGGAIFNSGTLIVTNSTFSGNSVPPLAPWGPSLGGAIANSYAGGTLIVTNSTFCGNSAGGAGGAIFNSGTLTVTNSTFSGNSAGENGSGGAILNESPGTLIVTNSTFSGNSAGGDGGGIENFDGTVTLTNTILANSSGGNCHGLFTDGGYNLQWPGTECGETIQSADPLLGPLADNGGPTDTMALLPNSPAIDAGDPDICANPPVNGVDQRGYRRPGTGSVVCSIGAYEYNSPGPCAGDCDGTGEVTSEDRITLLSVALGTAGPGECPDSDWTGDGAISVDELVLALNATPDVCPAFTPEQRCLASGGALSTAMCCLNAGDFPDTCSIGACRCAPVNSHEVRVCVCGESRCWDGSTCSPGGPSAHLAPAA